MYSRRFSAFGPASGSPMQGGRAGYGLVLKHQTDLSWLPLGFDGILANIGKINPVIEVYQRAD